MKFLIREEIAGVISSVEITERDGLIPTAEAAKDTGRRFLELR